MSSDFNNFKSHKALNNKFVPAGFITFSVSPRNTCVVICATCSVFVYVVLLCVFAVNFVVKMMKTFL